MMEILNRFTGKIIFKSRHKTKRETVIAAIKRGADLTGADLQGADLQGADLQKAEADLTEAKKRIEELKELGEVFLQLEHLSQIGSDMEGHELAQRMCQILHPELYEGQEQ